MITLVYGADEQVRQWVSGQLNVNIDDRCSAIGIAEDGQLIAGWVYTAFDGHSVMIHVASTDPRWMSKGRLFALFFYPFGQLEVVRINALIAKKNKRARRVCEKLGFKEEGTLRRGYDGKNDAIVYGMLKHECKWV